MHGYTGCRHKQAVARVLLTFAFSHSLFNFWNEGYTANLSLILSLPLLLIYSAPWTYPSRFEEKVFPISCEDYQNLLGREETRFCCRPEVQLVASVKRAWLSSPSHSLHCVAIPVIDDPLQDNTDPAYLSNTNT
ncbi:hypothetical protein E2C01_095201 [Portunus trituberculatus]|uniref:Uncharacterized protein n=1 Tax=Portunus trituberculatus TaxID=210409 RepID=A0A5B7JYU1_PORTR|nr:hypothetical protein [Portunus trituberculatus]